LRVVNRKIKRIIVNPPLQLSQYLSTLRICVQNNPTVAAFDQPKNGNAVIVKPVHFSPPTESCWWFHHLAFVVIFFPLVCQFRQRDIK
jgi:hypothetical protein